MTWLLRLYPPRWRRRYGAEVGEMLAGRGFSFAVAVDLIAGAIDVRLHPAATMAAATAAASTEEDKTMLSRIARLDCAGALGPDVTKADERKAAVWMIAGTLVLTLVWMGVHARIGDNDYVDSLSSMAFFVPLLYSMRYTYLKNRPGSVQAVFIGGLSLAVLAIMLAAAWLAARI